MSVFYLRFFIFVFTQAERTAILQGHLVTHLWLLWQFNDMCSVIQFSISNKSN